MRLLVILAGLASSFTVPIFAQQKDTTDPQIAQQIRVLAAKYDEAFNNRDASSVAALYTKDGVWATAHHGTFRGRKAIEKCLAKYDFELWRTHNIGKTVDTVTAVGNEVGSRGTWSFNYQDYQNRTRSADGTYLWILVREGDSWKIRRDAEIPSTEQSISGVSGSESP